MDDRTRRRMLDNGLGLLINALVQIKNQVNLSDEDKLTLVISLEKTFPDIRRALIALINSKKGN